MMKQLRKQMLDMRLVFGHVTLSATLTAGGTLSALTINLRHAP
jgi:hypothetical protein